ncbi:Flagellar protein FlaG protein [hydrothermal vent metagenome]|uniref:Flagellar protein FlaG protein n=1 Tax=hydrothermal vent metagenome TaxID=652676 RepID=A0A1W1BEX3_9ZZZZ
MDGIANVASGQQSQINSSPNQGHSQQVQHREEIKTREENPIEEMQKTDATTLSNKPNSKEKVEDLVKKLNDALAPIGTDLKFGVDRSDIFYVSVIDTKTDKIIRRFPAEKAQEFLPKMQEVSGILFDSKG